jgi:hypothetical protein
MSCVQDRKHWSTVCVRSARGLFPHPSLPPSLQPPSSSLIIHAPGVIAPVLKPLSLSLSLARSLSRSISSTFILFRELELPNLSTHAHTRDQASRFIAFRAKARARKVGANTAEQSAVHRLKESQDKVPSPPHTPYPLPPSYLSPCRAVRRGWRDDTDSAVISRKPRRRTTSPFFLHHNWGVGRVGNDPFKGSGASLPRPQRIKFLTLSSPFDRAYGTRTEKGRDRVDVGGGGEKAGESWRSWISPARSLSLTFAPSRVRSLTFAPSRVRFALPPAHPAY